MKASARSKGDDMLIRNTQDDSRIAVDVNLSPIAGAVDFESEAMPYLNDLYRTARHICPQSVNASEVVQETYLRARIGFDKYRPRTNCKRWLFQILFNVVRFERESCFAHVLGASAIGQAEFAGGNVPGDDVLSAINRVPLGLRQVLLLVDCQGFSYKEAAEILGLSSAAVARHIVLGRNHLQSELEACRSALVASAH
jgi:RNA polymerase sigma-70 factor (ECF subfamily)